MSKCHICVFAQTNQSSYFAYRKNDNRNRLAIYIFSYFFLSFRQISINFAS